MIEQKTVDGRKATVAYLDHDFNPVPKEHADIVKVLFEDGDVAFLLPRSDTDAED